MASSNGNQDSELVTGINVTPMVDITLVLLIIFMVTASFIVNSGLKVNLPKASTTEAQATASLTVTLDQSGGLFWRAVPDDQMMTTFHQALRHRAAHLAQTDHGDAHQTLPQRRLVALLMTE